VALAEEFEVAVARIAEVGEEACSLSNHSGWCTVKEAVLGAEFAGMCKRADEVESAEKRLRTASSITFIHALTL
jgi:hypothetical protein